MADQPPMDNWKIRRRWLKYSLLFQAANIEALICWVIVAGGTPLGVQVLLALLFSFMGALGYYVFGAAWDDHSKRKFGLPAISGEDCKATDDK